MQQPVPKADDGKVEGYSRVVNGKVVQVSGYGKKPSSSTRAALLARRMPGRPQMAAAPGTFAGGRDLPGLPAEVDSIPTKD